MILAILDFFDFRKVIPLEEIQESIEIPIVFLTHPTYDCFPREFKLCFKIDETFSSPLSKTILIKYEFIGFKNFNFKGFTITENEKC